MRGGWLHLFEKSLRALAAPDFPRTMRTMPTEDSHAFPATRWTLVRAAQTDADATSAFTALNEWCATYRRPIVVAARVKHGLSHEDAEDITQEFITWLLRREHLLRAEPMAGSKFRSFLLTYLGNFIGNWRQRQSAEKRGGKAGEHLLVHDSGDEVQPAVEIPTCATPDEEVDRTWVIATLRDVRARLRADYAKRDKEKECEVLMKSLSVTKPMENAKLAEQLGITEGALKVRVHRFRQEFRDMLRSVVREMVSCAEDLEEELALVRKFALE
jgi:RNA polymerase sigma-70 factor (ECF subfamily)